ncbi:Prefoldin [Pseudovirgaria hyperparasitica]|uniref:Prefoldin n=1 Tax=Pseudovirgaria hyperparasitica TaxID=470096 RepID=A0A6A6WHT3_9PEZI|nr:Prefoldin [Pseudovirgaria hyperparasitica]KAF2761600.1 Prefoldin [Pseudovirgaria hyperparasitica]
MAIPNQKLQQLLEEIEQKAMFSQQQINIVKSQMAAKNRESRMVQLTATELSSLPKDTNVYEGCGKMFLWSPSDEVKKRLATENSELKADGENLGKKLHYLETTYKNSKDGIEKLLRAGQGGA